MLIRPLHWNVLHTMNKRKTTELSFRAPVSSDLAFHREGTEMPQSRRQRHLSSWTVTIAGGRERNLSRDQVPKQMTEKLTFLEGILKYKIRFQKSRVSRKRVLNICPSGCCDRAPRALRTIHRNSPGLTWQGRASWAINLLASIWRAKYFLEVRALAVHTGLPMLS